MCRFATLLSTETSAKDALLLTSAKKHPTQFSFSSRLQWTSRFHVEAQLEFRTLLFVPRRAPVVLFEFHRWFEDGLGSGVVLRMDDEWSIQFVLLRVLSSLV